MRLAYVTGVDSNRLVGRLSLLKLKVRDLDERTIQEPESVLLKEIACHPVRTRTDTSMMLTIGLNTNSGKSRLKRRFLLSKE